MSAEAQTISTLQEQRRKQYDLITIGDEEVRFDADRGVIMDFVRLEPSTDAPSRCLRLIDSAEPVVMGRYVYAGVDGETLYKGHREVRTLDRLEAWIADNDATVIVETPGGDQ